MTERIAQLEEWTTYLCTGSVWFLILISLAACMP